MTALHLAAKNGHLEVVEYLEAEGAFIYSSDYRGKTPLHLAVESNHSEVVEFLLEVGTSSEVLGTCGQTPLYFAAEHGSHDAVNKLLEKGADPDKSGGSSDRGPIYAAIKSGNVDCVELLLKHGANPDGSNEMPQIRPLHKALKFEPEELRKKMVELLIKYKVDVCKPGFSGSPLDVAVKHPPFEGWLKSFVSWGAKIPTNVFEEKDGSEFKAAADELAQIYATTSDDVALAGAEGSGEVADIA